jgi:hypothetical protein
MDPLEFLNERLREAPSVVGSMWKRSGALFPVPYAFSGNPGSLLDPESAPPDVGTPEPGPMHSSSRYYAGDKYGYQSPESYKEIYKGFPEAYIDMINKTPKDKPPNTGDFRSPDNKYYTDEKYGYQSPDSYNKVIGSYPAGYVKPRTGTGTGAAMPGNVKAPVSNTVSETKTPTSLEMIDRLLDKYSTRGLEEKAVSFDRLQQQTEQNAQIAMAKTDAKTKREIELRNIDAWSAKQLALIEAGTRRELAFAQTMTILQQPNRGTMDALTTAFDAGAAPFAGRVRRG